MNFKITQQERGALQGLPYLPRLAYLIGIRPYMDYGTGIVGIKRGISYQSLREELYIEPHKGYASGSPSKDQMRRAVKTLERAGLISIQSEGMKLILKCELATWDYCDQNKVATKAPQVTATKTPYIDTDKSINYNLTRQKAATTEIAKAATPPVSDINYIFVCDAFKKFWRLYPIKQSKPKAWDAFQTLAPNAELLDLIIDALTKQCAYRKEAAANNYWMPHWKHAANWLLQRGWEDELPAFTFLSEEINNANSKRNYTQKSTATELLWESCKDAFDEHTDSTEDTENTNDERKVIYLNTKRTAY